MKNKYYTPDPEEFCIGFEYESLQDERFPDEDNSWEKNIISDEWHLRKFIEYYCGDHIEIRAKHLDREDIESLGFEQIEYDTYKKVNVYIELDMEYKTFINAVVQGAAVILFQGTIKNKSELKKLLKQLGI